MNQTREKARLLAIARRCQPAYDALLAKGSSVIVCAGGRTFTVVWRKENYMHLCGWEYFRDRAKTMPASAGEFYDRLRKGQSLESLVRPAHAPRRHEDAVDPLRWARAKARVLPEALDVGSATHVVVSAKGGIVIFFGAAAWAMGLGLNEDGTYHPKTLVAVGISDGSVRRRGSPMLPILRVE